MSPSRAGIATKEADTAARDAIFGYGTTRGPAVTSRSNATVIIRPERDLPFDQMIRRGSTTFLFSRVDDEVVVVSAPRPRIDETVSQIGDEQTYHHGQDVGDEDTHHDRVVVEIDRVYQLKAHAWVGEYLLDEDRPREGEAQREHEVGILGEDGVFPT